MPNITNILNEQIRRMARREIKSDGKIVRKAMAQYRRDIAALKRDFADLTRTVGSLQGQEKRRVAQQPAADSQSEDVRFRADGLISQRKRLGISAKDYGVLVGVTGQTIYDWESGKSRPRKEQVGKLAAVRGIGKREVSKRLAPAGASEAQPRRQGGRFDQTAEEFVAALVKSGKATTSTQINTAWKSTGRGGKADNTLSRMYKTKKLIRTKLKDERGSSYRVA